jgi:hypothetical protein
VAGATSSAAHGSWLAAADRPDHGHARYGKPQLRSDSRGLKPEPADWDSLLILNLFVLLMSFFSCVTGFF